jgi:glycerol kinase
VVISVDQGTTNTKAVVVDAASGVPLRVASRSVGIAFPGPGRAEQDPNELWSTTLSVLDECLNSTEGLEPLGLAISNQRESVVCWSRSSGAALGPVLGWQDARTASWCADLIARHPDAPQLVQTRTGLPLDPMFSAPKIRAALDAATEAGADLTDVAIGTVDAWLVWRLTGRHVTDVGNASRTLLLDLRSLAWDVELADMFGIPVTSLPSVVASDSGFGRVRAELGVLGGLPVVAVLADSHAALYQQGCREPGTGKATYGTGTSVMSVVPTIDAAPSGAPAGVSTTVAWQVDDEVTFAREGNIAASGSALDWMASTLGAPADVSGGAFLTELASGVADAGGASFVPAFSGLGAPYWDRSAVGLISGVSAATGRAHLARAALESVAHQVADVVEAMESDGIPAIAVMQADGGASASRLLMQIQADVLGRPVQVAAATEASALGAATLAARTLGFATPDARSGECISPRPIDRVSARQAWAGAVARSRGVALASNSATPQDADWR